MNRLHLLLAAVLDTARAGGLPGERAEALFDSLSPYLRDVPEGAVAAFEETARRILDADLP
jgi:hypothetical protein